MNNNYRIPTELLTEGSNIRLYAENCNEAFENQNVINLGINLRLLAEEICYIALSNYRNNLTGVKLQELIQYISYNKILSPTDVNILEEIRYAGNNAAHAAAKDTNINQLNKAFALLATNFTNIISEIQSFLETNDGRTLYNSDQSKTQGEEYIKICKHNYKVWNLYQKCELIACGFIALVGISSFVTAGSSGLFFTLLAAVLVGYDLLMNKIYNSELGYKRARQKYGNYVITKSFFFRIDFSIPWDDMVYSNRYYR